MAVDHPCRERLLAALEQFRCGKITNDDIEAEADAVACVSQDEGLGEVAQIISFNFHDPYKTFRLKTDDVPKFNESFEVIILFLSSDVEYRWQRKPFWTECRAFWGSLLRRREKTCDEQEAGDVNVWPFFNEVELNEARARFGSRESEHAE